MLTQRLLLRIVLSQRMSCRGMTCRICGDAASDVVKIEVPYVFRYLLAELLSMNVKVSLDVKPAT
jgi:DNA-directed RNA polymerase beta subunit